MQSTLLFPSGSSFPLLRHLFQPLLLLVCSTAMFGQIDRAVLEGAVTDQTGAAIVGANVKVVQRMSGRASAAMTPDTPSNSTNASTVCVPSVGFEPTLDGF